MPKIFNQVSIIGLGLIGGSLGMAIKKNKISSSVVGVVRRPSTGKKALKLKIVDRWTLSLKEGVKDSDLIIISTPVGKVVPTFKKIIPYIKGNCIITDVGSTKAKIVKEVNNILSQISNLKSYIFIGGHPLAGSEQSGIDFAREDLFKSAVYFLTPQKNTPYYSLALLKKFIKSLGAKPVLITPKEHDYLLAGISHFPHIVATSLVNTVASAKKKDEMLSLVGNGFKDTTRIAASSPELWVDISLSNKDNILTFFSLLKKSIIQMEGYLKKEERKKLWAKFAKAQKIREKIK